MGTPSKLILFTYESWANLDDALDGLTPEKATTSHEGGSAIAWTLGHVTTMVDSWINVRFQGLPPHPVISNANFDVGGDGEEKDWLVVQEAVKEVREATKPFLNSMPEPDLDRTIPYTGSIPLLRSVGLSLRYALMRIISHHYIHMGEIVTIRSRLGHVDDTGPNWGRALM